MFVGDRKMSEQKGGIGMEEAVLLVLRRDFVVGGRSRGYGWSSWSNSLGSRSCEQGQLLSPIRSLHMTRTRHAKWEEAGLELCRTSLHAVFPASR